MQLFVSRNLSLVDHYVDKLKSGWYQMHDLKHDVTKIWRHK